MSYRLLAVHEAALATKAIQVLWTTFEVRHSPIEPSEVIRLLQRPGFRLFAALDDAGQVLGAVSAYELLGSDYRSAELLLWDVAVLPAYQRQGIGAGLLAAVRAWCAGAGIGLVLVMAEGEDLDAQSFYRALPQATEQTVQLFSYEATDS
jgi:aminoglycoside 3-N-acetyltransferase I